MNFLLRIMRRQSHLTFLLVYDFSETLDKGCSREPSVCNLARFRQYGLDQFLDLDFGVSTLLIDVSFVSVFARCKYRIDASIMMTVFSFVLSYLMFDI